METSPPWPKTSWFDLFLKVLHPTSNQKKLAQSEMNKVIDYRTRNERFLAEHTNSNLEKQQ